MRLQIAMLVLSSVAALPCFAADENGKFTGLGVGTMGCGEVVSDFKKNGQGKLINSAWVSGYLTAINARVTNRKNIAERADSESRDLWINNYCTANPLESLVQATEALVQELSTRRP